MSTQRVRRRIRADRATTAAAAAIAVIGLTVAGIVAVAAPATAALPGSETTAVSAASASAEGEDGQRLEATPTTDLPAEGGTITVSGSGYDDFKGIYVAVCKVPEDGGVPTPCGGGIDTEGASGSSQWISSNPPSYGEGLAVPYEKGGSFEVSVSASAVLASGEDCREVACAVVTRADHTRTSDRSQDVLVPVTFASETAAATDDGPSTSTVLGVIGLGLLLAVIAALVSVVRMRRREAPTASSSGQDPA